MKPSLLILAFLFLSITQTFSQYCGNFGSPSGPSQCVPSGSLTQPGFSPESDSLPPLINGSISTTVIQFQNFDTITFGGQALIVQSFRIDSIGNLPDGLCWATNTATNTFLNQAAGCIRMNGTTCAPPGQYRLKIIVTVDVGVPIQTDASAAGLFYYLRVNNPGQADIPVDTTGQAAGTNTFIDYGIVPSCIPNGTLVGVSGKLFVDANQNQIFDVGEQPVPNQIVNIGSNYTALTNASGNYTAYPPAGTYTVVPTLSGNLSAFAFNPNSIIVHADSAGVFYRDNNFGVIVPANYCEGTIAIIANTPPARPGFFNTIDVRFTNTISASPVSQTVQFQYDALQHFSSASGAPASIDTVNHILTWNLANIPSGSSWQERVMLYTPQTVSIGSVLHMTAIVTNSTCAQPDLPQTDEEIMVVGSYDPNDKAVSPVGVEPGGRVPSNSKLSYTIRFQNTGTYLAENVNVVDTISALLNLSTLQVQAASHNYEVLINGREVTFRFSQIMLADSNTNEPMSHGYIKYSIQPTTSFVQGSVIENLADIYFDFNSAIRTNTTQNRADNFIGITKTQADEFGFEVYPNPLSSGNWSLTTDAELMGKEMKIFDAAGRVVYSARIAKQQMQIEASGFPQGVYLLRIGSSGVRIIKL